MINFNDHIFYFVLFIGLLVFLLKVCSLFVNAFICFGLHLVCAILEMLVKYQGAPHATPAARHQLRCGISACMPHGASAAAYGEKRN